MTFSQLRTLVWSWLDDPNGTYFTEVQVNVWLNNAQRECQKQLIQAGENFYVTSVYTSTVQNYDTYALPTDFMRLNKLQVLLSGTSPNENRAAITPVTLVQLDQVSMSTGTPQAHCIRKNCIVLRPIPDNTYTVYMDYSYLVNDMVADSSVPDVPIQYQEYLAVLASIDGFLKDQRDASPFFAKRDFYLSLMKQDAENRHVDAPRQVVCTDGGDMGVLF